MIKTLRRLLPLAGLAAFLLTSHARARELTFEQRVAFQAAIERVYHAHQIGAKRSFAEAVPRPVLERKVHTYLRQSATLERYWNTPVTGEALRREVERMARESRMPGRLAELFAALGNDAFVVEECLGRAALVDRLSRDFFAFDPRFHASAREEIERLRQDLVDGALDARGEHPLRTVVEVARVEGAKDEVERGRRVRNDPAVDHRVLELGPDEFARTRASLARVGQIGRVTEEREEFLAQVVLEDEPTRLRVATFAVPKRTWDDWWSEIAAGIDDGGVHTTAAADHELPSLQRDPEEEEGETRSTCPAQNAWDTGAYTVGRSSHSAVWTGSVMVVWGGIAAPGANDYLITGLRYDPATNTLTPTSTVNAPQGRTDHTAVWSGTRMIVWGGHQANAFFQGGSYDPSTDTWTPTSTTAAPSARAFHSAI